MNSVVSLPIAAAIPTSAPALSTTDPIFAALDNFRRAEAEFYADYVGEIPDDIGDRWHEAVAAVVRTQPTTPAGLGALTSFAREMTERADHDATLGDDQWVPIMTSIEAAARGMSGLQPWTPPEVGTNGHPDASLIELEKEFDRFLELERPLKEENRGTFIAPVR